MTLVETNGELVRELSADEARTLTDRIKVGVEAVWQLYVEAYHRGAHRALGYSSFDDYCTREFGTLRIRLPKEKRQEVVASLSESGLSQRAIAAATGLDRKTVRADIEVGESGPPAKPIFTPVDIDPETGEIVEADTSANGESVATSTDGAAPGVDGTGAAAPSLSPEPNPAPRVTGIDGKSYPAKRVVTPLPKAKDRRPPLTDAAERAGWQFRKSVERLERIASDDRFAANKGQVAAHLRGHLSYAVEVCQDLIDQLNEENREH